MKRKLVILSIAVFLFYFIWVDGSDEPLKKVTFIPLWVPQAQFAGYYVALEKGIYKKHGLDVSIIDGGPDRPPSDYLKEHKADFAIMWLSTGIQQRDEGVPIINIAQILKRSALILVAKKSSGILKPEDMDNKKVGLWEGTLEIQPRAFFKKYDVSVTIVPQTYSVNLFLRDGVDVASAMWYNEYHRILNSGYDQDELTTFFFYDHGLNFPEDGIYTLEDTYKKDPDMCCAFVEATLEGWKYAFENPEEAIDIVLSFMRKAHIPANRVHQKWMLDRMRDLMISNEKYITGTLNKKTFIDIADILKENGVIKSIPDFNSFCVDCHSEIMVQDSPKEKENR